MLAVPDGAMRGVRQAGHVVDSFVVLVASGAAVFAALIIAAYVGGEPRSGEGGVCTGGPDGWAWAEKGLAAFALLGAIVAVLRAANGRSAIKPALASVVLLALWVVTVLLIPDSTGIRCERLPAEGVSPGDWLAD